MITEAEKAHADEVLKQILDRIQTKEFQDMVRERIKKENEEFEKWEKMYKPTWEDMHKTYDI
jgi:hypothetical protein